MPLVTDDIYQARTAYNALELRAEAAEQTAAALQANLNFFTANQTQLSQSVLLQGQYTASQVGVNGALQSQQANAIAPDVALADFIRAMGLAVAMGEASMPDRTVSSVSVTIQSYVTANPSTPESLIGLRLYQPELGTPTALATTSFDLNKVTLTPGTPAPRSLYLVLQDKQNTFANAFWTKFTTGSPPTQPGQQIVAEIGKVFASIGTWTFPYLIQEAGTIAGFETSLASSLSGAVPSSQLAVFAAAVQSVTSLTQSLAARSDYAAGDLFALTAALDASTTAANALLP
jgi:hypothetical protein